MQLNMLWQDEKIVDESLTLLMNQISTDFSQYEQFYCYQIFESPLGSVLAIASEKGICLLAFCNQKNIFKLIAEINKERKVGFVNSANQFLKTLDVELKNYFNAGAKSFSVPLDFVGTPFQQKVWEQLLKIPYGTTVSYKYLSNIIADEKSVRAVANANAKNKISIIVPCHRVVGSNHSLTGYAGGIERKQQLLLLESNQ